MRDVISRNGSTLKFPNYVNHKTTEKRPHGDLVIMVSGSVGMVQMPTDRLVLDEKIELTIGGVRGNYNVLSISEARPAKGDWSAYPEQPEFVTCEVRLAD